ncbi:MAG: 3-oxocholest-4-en-26-oate---CoA ligase [Actinomycetota bacterium]|nr:3-oxocholest-4-en-26-oate---CoA ligase [Actinomycetota bacterium]
MQFNLADLFERVADAVAERDAAICGTERRTYAQLDERSTRLAHLLAGRGVGPGTHVALYMYNSISHLEAMFACYKLRAVPINVNYRYVDDELEYLLADADAVGIVHDAGVRERAARVATRCPDVRFVLDVESRSFAAELEAASPARDLGPRSSDDHYVLYTGGTTGMPKGVLWRHEDIFFGAMGGGNPGGPPIRRPDEITASVIDNPAQRLRPFLPDGDPGPPQFVSLALGPLMHASGQWSAIGTLLGGGKVVLYDRLHVDMEHVLDLVEREHVNAMNLVGDASARPLLAKLAEHRNRWDTSSLRLVGSGGSILSGDTKEALMAELPSVLAIVEGIGSSESPAQAVAVTTRADRAAPSRSLTFVAKAETVVVDDDLRPLPRGSAVVGRLATRGRVPLGYYNDPDRSARTFVEIDGARWSLPGDMATIDTDGTVHLLGRGSLCINTGGEKVYPEEVEAVLKSHPNVADAVVVGAPDAQFGQRVVAIVAPAPGTPAPDLAALQEHCRAHLAGYKVPRAAHVVDVVVRTAAGKADYAWARAIATP